MELINLIFEMVIAISIYAIAVRFADVRDYLHGIYESINRHEEQINELKDIAYQLERIAHVEEMEQ